MLTRLLATLLMSFGALMAVGAGTVSRLTWRRPPSGLSFEITVTSNAPATLTSAASTAPVRVSEQGSVVTSVG